MCLKQRSKCFRHASPILHTHNCILVYNCSRCRLTILLPCCYVNLEPCGQKRRRLSPTRDFRSHRSLAALVRVHPSFPSQSQSRERRFGRCLEALHHQDGNRVYLRMPHGSRKTRRLFSSKSDGRMDLPPRSTISKTFLNLLAKQRGNVARLRSFATERRANVRLTPN